MSTAVAGAAALPRFALPPEHYPGLRPFDRQEHRIFFGREEMIDTIIDSLARNNLVVVHGASGSGKSSIVRAGVLPWLELQQSRRGGWRTKILRPTGEFASIPFPAEFFFPSSAYTVVLDLQSTLD